jgi:hypothetical protein
MNQLCDLHYGFSPEGSASLNLTGFPGHLADRKPL